MESGVIIISKPCAPINSVEPCVTDTLLLIKAVDLVYTGPILLLIPSTYTGSLKYNRGFALVVRKPPRERNSGSRYSAHSSRETLHINITQEFGNGVRIISYPGPITTLLVISSRFTTQKSSRQRARIRGRGGRCWKTSTQTTRDADSSGQKFLKSNYVGNS